MINEKKPIDANVLKSRMENLCDEYGTDHLFIDAIVYEIESAPAVGVVHGRWECAYDEIIGETEVTCSNCKDTRTINGCFVTTEGESCYFEDNYCPNCGARMEDPV